MNDEWRVLALSTEAAVLFELGQSQLSYDSMNFFKMSAFADISDS